MSQIQPETIRRTHPDLFTSDEAAAYLHLESDAGLETCRRDFGLIGHRCVNKSFMYWREDLDKCALRMVGRDPAWIKNEQPQLRIAGGRR